MDEKIERIKELAKDMGIAFQLAGTTRFGPVAESLVEAGYRKESDTAQLAIQRFINQLHIDKIIIVDSDLGKELLKEKEFVLKRYYGVDLGEDN